MLPDIGDFLFYDIRRFVPGLVGCDVTASARGLAFRVAGVAAVLHEVGPGLGRGTENVVPHLVGGSLLSFSYPRANLIVAFGFGNRLLHRLLGLLRGSCRVLLPVVSALPS